MFSPEAQVLLDDRLIESSRADSLLLKPNTQSPYLADIPLAGLTRIAESFQKVGKTLKMLRKGTPHVAFKDPGSGVENILFHLSSPFQV
jgi:hypothetical protein